MTAEHGPSDAPVTGATHGSTERAARWVAGPTLSFDLTDEVRRLLDEEGLGETGRNAKTLVKEADLRVVLVGLRRGTSIDPHQAAGPITIQVISGHFRVSLPEQHVNLAPGQFVALEASLRHSVTATEDGAFLLTIAWPGHTRAPASAAADPRAPAR